jgi:hypothetical protein
MVPIPSVQISQSNVEFLVNGQLFRTWIGNVQELKVNEYTNLMILIRDHIAFRTKGPDFDAFAKQMGLALR